MKHTFSQIEKIFKAKTGQNPPMLYKTNYLFVTGIRTTNEYTNLFDDYFHITFVDKDGVYVEHEYSCTTKPGGFWLQNPMTKKGTAIVVPGYYPGLWKVGFHKGEYKCLDQVGEIKLYRDNNKDLHYDEDPSTIETISTSCIELHRSNPAVPSTYNTKWSAGCQVCASPLDFEQIMEYAYLHEPVNGLFPYFLIEEKDFANIK